jgi:hypothetical protein
MPRCPAAFPGGQGSPQTSFSDVLSRHARDGAPASRPRYAPRYGAGYHRDVLPRERRRTRYLLRTCRLLGRGTIVVAGQFGLHYLRKSGE